MAKKKQQDGSAAVQILRGGQHLRVYGGNVHQTAILKLSEDCTTN